MEKLDQFISTIEKSPWLMAAMVILSNIGFKFIEKDLDEKNCKSWLDCEVSRKFIIFALIFCSTKSLKVSVVSTFIYWLTVNYVLR